MYIDFLHAAVGDVQNATIVIGGEFVNVQRGDFGTHLKLALIAKDIYGTSSTSERATAIERYVVAAGVDVSGANGLELIAAYVELSELNKLDGTLPFMEKVGKDNTDTPPYDYGGRQWAVWVHSIASRYGWTRQTIFSLSPEEVACYIQEIIVSEINERDFERSLTEIAYKYDEGSKTSTFIPAPRPAWMLDKADESPRKNKIRKNMLPVGNVIDLSGMGLIGESNGTKTTEG